MKKSFNPVRYFLTDLRFSKKLIISFLLLLLIPTAAVSVLMYGEITDLVVTDTVNNYAQLSEQTTNTANTITRRIRNVADMLKNDSYLRETVMHPAFSHTDDIEYSEILRDSFMTFIDSYKEDPLVKDIRIYLDTPYKDLYENSGQGDVFQSMSLTKGTYWGGIMSTNKTDTLFCAPFYLSNRE
ncbi:MAG: hypothetical protein IJ857_03225, partial [Lachnospiraceae bacterium]|nr:hypothetical protein [Lachnospiraceae bacterium]